MKRSTKDLFRLHGRERFGRFLHGYIYLSRTRHYLGTVLNTVYFADRHFPGGKVLRFLLGFMVPYYHSKVVRHEDAKKILTLNEDLQVEIETSKKVMPFEIANKIVIEHPDHLAVVDCPCRRIKKDKKCSSPKHGIQVCLLMGEPMVSFVLDHGADLHARGITSHEALAIIQDAHDLGWVHMVWFKDAVGERSFALCNCCKCCCGGMIGERIARRVGYESDFVLPSGYFARVIEEKCDNCMVCAKICQLGAYRKNAQTQKPEVVYDKCFGCGVCVDQCPRDAITLVRDPGKGVPLDIDELTPSRVM
jgi:Pyruvate/2-oxoacid:ferredoxin oxidoreductase delta subunit